MDMNNAMDNQKQRVKYISDNESVKLRLTNLADEVSSRRTVVVGPFVRLLLDRGTQLSWRRRLVQIPVGIDKGVACRTQ